MKIYEVKNGQRKTTELLDTPFKSDFLNFKDVDDSFPDFIMIGYNDKTLLEELPYYPIESTAFSIETMGENPEIKLNVFYELDSFGGKDMETLEVVFNESEKDEIQTILLKVICDLTYGVPMFLKDIKSVVLDDNVFVIQHNIILLKCISADADTLIIRIVGLAQIGGGRWRVQSGRWPVP